MLKNIFLIIAAVSLLPASVVVAHAQLTAVPAPFQNAKADSTYSIKYDDVNELLRKTVVNTGRSSRERAEPNRASTGTRMRNT